MLDSQVDLRPTLDTHGRGKAVARGLTTNCMYDRTFVDYDKKKQIFANERRDKRKMRKNYKKEKFPVSPKLSIKTFLNIWSHTISSL